ILNANGVATFTSTALSVGVRAITAQYSGDTTFPASTSQFVGQTVNQASTTTSLTSSLNPSTSGQLVTFMAVVTANSPGAAAPTGTPSQKFVTQVFRDLLGRDPDPGGLTHFTMLLDMNQATRSQVAASIQTSSEARNRQVQNLYQTLLGRAADAVGLDLSTRFLSAG